MEVGFILLADYVKIQRRKMQNGRKESYYVIYVDNIFLQKTFRNINSMHIEIIMNVDVESVKQTRISMLDRIMTIIQL